MPDKYNTSRDLHQRRVRYTPTVAPTWDILQTLFGFAFTIQQEMHKLRLENNAIKNSQPVPPTVQAGYPSALGRIVASAQNLTEASGAAIALGTEQSMVCVARSGAYAPPLGSQLDARSGLSGECIRSRDSVICMNAAADPRVDYKACMALGIRSMVYLPLLQEDRVAGVLAVFSSKPQHFSHRDLNCLRWTDQLISEALQAKGSSEVGAATLVRTVEFGEPEAAPAVLPVSTTAAETEMPAVQNTPVVTQPAAAAVAPAEVKVAEPRPEAIFVGSFVDEGVEDEFFRESEPNPKLAPQFNQSEKYDSPIPILVAMLLVVAFLGAVSLMTYKRLSSAVRPAAPKPSVTSPAQSVATPTVLPEQQTSAEEPAKATTTPGFPSGVSFQTAGSHATLTMALPKHVTYEGFAIQGPNRVYFDVRGISLTSSKGISVPVDHDLVSRVRISLFRPGTTRIVFDLRGDNPFGVKVSENTNQLAIDISPKDPSDPGAISPKPGEAVKITSDGNQVLRKPALPPYAAK